MRHLLLDVEASGLISNTGKMPEHIWLICTEDLETGEKKDFYGDAIYKEFPAYAKQFDRFIGHNIVGYDGPLLSALTDFSCSLSQMIDTKILSKICNPDRGYHSLSDWGDQLNFPKGDFTDFENFMDHFDKGLKYCRRDVDVLRRLYYRLLQEQKAYGISEQAVRSEHLVHYFILRQQWNGFPLDIPKVDSLHSEVVSKIKFYEKKIEEQFKPIAKPVKEITPKYKRDGSLSIVGLKFLDNDWTKVCGPLTRIEWVPFDLNSPKQIVERLNILGWDPVEKTKGHIKAEKDFVKGLIPQERLDHFRKYGWSVSEKNLETLPDDAPEAARMIAGYVLCESRRRLIETQWWPSLGDDNKLHGYCDPLGAGTHRMTHNNPNMANIPSVRTRKQEDGTEKILRGFEGRYGYDARECFTVEDKKKYVLFGADASGLELRMLAHFMGNEEFTREVISGDPHIRNMKLAGLPSKAVAKTTLYAILYGAGPPKIGRIVKGGYKEGLTLKGKILDTMPGLEELIERVEKDYKLRGYVRGLDGRIIHVRHKHAALNTLLQGNGAIVCKWWLIFTMQKVRELNLDVKLLGSIHDEYQFQVLKEHVEPMEKIVRWAITKTEKFLKVRCRLDCDSKTGTNWAETH